MQPVWLLINIGPVGHMYVRWRLPVHLQKCLTSWKFISTKCPSSVLASLYLYIIRQFYVISGKQLLARLTSKKWCGRTYVYVANLYFAGIIMAQILFPLQQHSSRTSN